MLLAAWAVGFLLQCGDPPSRASLAYWDYLRRCGCAGTDAPSRASNDYERYVEICSAPPAPQATQAQPSGPSPPPRWPSIQVEQATADTSASPPRGVALREAAVQVVRVIDGDTLDVLVQGRLTKVRLFGVDAPELNQPFGKEARQATVDLLRGQAVEIETSRTDEHGRRVARVRAAGVDVATKLVEQGAAWWSPEYAPKERGLAAAERSARDRRMGLWSHVDAVAPWDWRDAHRQGQ